MLSSPPIVYLVILIVLAAVVRLTIMHNRPTPTAGGGIVMAIGIFGLAALQRIPALAAFLNEPLALLLSVIWLFTGAAYLIDFFKGTLHVHTESPIGRFGIGTWVAGTAVLARMEMVGVEDWSMTVEAMLGFIALLLWIWYIPLALEGFKAMRACHERLQTRGVILLSTVSTQSLALIAADLAYSAPLIPWFDPGVWRVLFAGVATVLIVLGTGFYIVGVGLILQRYWRQKNWTLVHDWDNTNCILHGAMSITGLAAVLSGTIPILICLLIWLYVFTMFILVELIEVARAYLRIKALGWQEGVFTYHVSQWARNFTFGMYYAFTWAFIQHFETYLVSPLAGLFHWILTYGQYFVLLFLLIEIGLYLRDHIDLKFPLRFKGPERIRIRQG
ncbi:MAG: hypothetical protein J5I81_11035 [Nitrococcus mobilis]|nr:hypothetical protein [Nitrococcus mobilis]